MEGRYFILPLHKVHVHLRRRNAELNDLQSKMATETTRAKQDTQRAMAKLYVTQKSCYKAVNTFDFLTRQGSKKVPFNHSWQVNSLSGQVIIPSH